MASATSGSPQGNIKQPQQQQQQHAREESGYLSSTIGSSVPNLHTIGVSRGAALLSNRPLGAGGSAPPAAAAAGAAAPTSGRQPLADYFQNPNGAPLAERFPGGLPANAAFDSDDEDHHNLLPHVDDNGSDVDFGLKTIGRQNHSMTSNDIVNSDAGFYKLGGGTAGIGQGHVLSSEALAERMLRGIRQSPSIQSEIAHVSNYNGLTRASSTIDGTVAHEASYSTLPSVAQPPGGAGGAGLIPPRTTKVSLGSPFAQQQGQQAISNGTVVIPVTSIAKTAAGNGNGNGNGNGKSNGNGSSARKPPPVAGNTAAAASGRTRKVSDASEKSVKKDDLLDRLATALRYERKLVEGYKRELVEAEESLNKMVEAEKIRDIEFNRLKTRHARDKQYISALKLKIERQELELTRAADVPEHEAEAYLDLIEGNASSSFVKPRKGGHRRGGEDDGTLQYEGSSEDETERRRRKDRRTTDREDDEAEEEMSMKALLEKQDSKGGKNAGGQEAILDAAWTAQLVEEQEKRRKLFAKKRKQEAKEYAAAMKEASATLDRQNTSSTLDPDSSGAQKQSVALRKAGLDQSVPFGGSGEDTGIAFTSAQSRPQKISFKDTIKRTFGRKMSGTAEGHFQISAPYAGTGARHGSSMSLDIQPGRKAEEFYTPLERPRMVVAPPTPGQDGLPEIPIDPKVNKKDAQAQNRRMLALKDHVQLNEGTYGRSASMDVPRPSARAGTGSETNLTRSGSKSKGFMGLVRGASGYGSDSDAAQVTSPSKGGFSIPGFGLGKSIGPGSGRPPASAARFGAQAAPHTRGRKWSLGRSASTPTSGGFFQHRE